MQKQILGVVDCTNDENHGGYGISRSGEYERPKASKALYLGSLVHTLTLEPHLFDDEYCLKPELQAMPEKLLLKDAGREAYDLRNKEREDIKAHNDNILKDFAEQSENKAVVDDDMMEQAMAMKDAVLRNQTATEIMEGAKFEKSIYWEHKPTGLICKARPDIWNGRIVADLKTTLSANFREFQLSAYKDGYFLQAAMMYEALKSINEPFHNFVYICVEKSKPYSVALYMLDDEALQFGLDMFHSLMDRLKKSYDTNIWPDYGIQKLTVPKYATLETNNE